MASISASSVKELREITGAGMMDCKKALSEADGDMEKAQEILREKGLAAAQKKAGRIAAEGVVGAYVGDDAHVGALIEVNCETDFVAHTPEFQAFVKDLAIQVADKDPSSLSSEDEAGTGTGGALLDQKLYNNADMTVQECVNEEISKVGEKVTIRRFVRYDAPDGAVGEYIHGGGTIGVLVQVNCDNASVTASDEFRSFVRDIAMHIAATNPMYLSEADIDPAVLEKEKEIQTAMATNEGKPPQVVEKMVAGRLKKFKKEICLLDQPFVKDPDMTVQQYVDQEAAKTGSKVTIVRYTRFQMGEGLEKRQDDFAQEVAAQAGI